MGSQRVGHDSGTDLIWSDNLCKGENKYFWAKVVFITLTLINRNCKDVKSKIYFREKAVLQGGLINKVINELNINDY